MQERVWFPEYPQVVFCSVHALQPPSRGKTVTVAEADAVPPAPVQAIVYVVVEE